MLHSPLIVARLVDAYLGAHGDSASPALARAHADAIDGVLADLCARGRAAHPDVAVEDVVFAAHLGRCGAAVQALSSADIHAEDLYLCCAGLLGDEGAVRTLRARNRAALAGYLRNIDTSPSFVEEVEQRLWDAALIGTVNAAPKLASYAGRGPLGAWIGVAAQRIALTIRRNDAAEARARGHVAVEANLVTGDPELAFVKQHLRKPFQRAIVEALRSLDDRQRMIYTLHVIDGVTIERIGVMYGVNRSTVTRWMASARDAIIAAARRLLRDQMQLSAEEFESLARLLSSQLDLSVSGVLRRSA
jgi:RNA polymerase sigma-70 factor, ECF subfamily